MNFNFRILVFAVGFAILVEGFLYSAFPSYVKKVLLFLESLSEREIRIIGIVALLIGSLIILIWRFLI